jgi:hypothetical protein
MWFSLERKSMKPIDNARFSSAFARKTKTEVVKFLHGRLKQKDGFSRGDYQELCELCLLVLGEKFAYQYKAPGIRIKLQFICLIIATSHIRFSGACHHARWMAKIIYVFKMFLMRDELDITAEIMGKIEELCLFYALVYVPAWIRAPVTSDAPVNDLVLIKQLHEYRSLNNELAEAALEKFQGHLWYLGAELAGFAFFSDKVPPKTKFAMMKNLKKPPQEESRPLKLLLTNKMQLQNIKLENLINSTTAVTLDLLGNTEELLSNHPSKWKKMACYLNFKSRVDSIKVN